MKNPTIQSTPKGQNGDLPKINRFELSTFKISLKIFQSLFSYRTGVRIGVGATEQTSLLLLQHEGATRHGVRRPVRAPSGRVQVPQDRQHRRRLLPRLRSRRQKLL